MWWLLIRAIYLVSIVRWLRWLGFAQQKEYRSDRLIAWFQTPEANRELLHFIPNSSEFTRTGLKRPRFTPRIAVVAVMSLLEIFFIGWLGWWWSGSLGLAAAAFCTYVCLPIIVVLATVPTTLISEIFIRATLMRAAYTFRHRRPFVIGVGGCYGKTSTKLILHHVLSAWKPTFTTPYSYNTRYSVAKSILTGYTDQEFAIIEYGTYRTGEIQELANYFPPQIAIETGFTEQHLSLFGSIEQIYAAEGELAGAVPPDGLIFCHAQDPGALKIAETGAKYSKARIVPYTGTDSTVKLTQQRLDQRGAFEFAWQGKQIQTKLIGRHYQVNIQAAIAVATHLGVPAPTIQSALESFQPNSRFIQSIEADWGLLIDDGYSVNPMGFEAALELVKELSAKLHVTRPIIVFGGIVDLGELSGHIHTRLAKICKSLNAEVWYPGQIGKSEFETVFGAELLTKQSQIIDRWRAVQQETGNKTIVLTEGRLPAWFTYKGPS